MEARSHGAFMGGLLNASVKPLPKINIYFPAQSILYLLLSSEIVRIFLSEVRRAAPTPNWIPLYLLPLITPELIEDPEAELGLKMKREV